MMRLRESLRAEAWFGIFPGLGLRLFWSQEQKLKSKSKVKTKGASGGASSGGLAPGRGPRTLPRRLAACGPGSDFPSFRRPEGNHLVSGVSNRASLT